MTTYFVSDTHFGHKNILKYSAQTRPFAPQSELDAGIISNDSINSMNRAIINAWNSTVTDKDEIYHLGDVFFKSKKQEINDIWNELKGIKHLIYGNHDHTDTRALPWQSKGHAKFLNISGIDLHLYHFPIVNGQWNKANHGGLLLYGHVHGEKVLPDNARALDVGIDSIGFEPISFDDVVNMLNHQPIIKVHHNGERP